MSDLRTAARQALEAYDRGLPVTAATAMGKLRSALAQQEQEPVTDLRCAFWLDPECADAGACQSLKFKANPPRREWQSLTDEEIQRMGNETPGQQGGWNLAFARAIEAALKERNT